MRFRGSGVGRCVFVLLILGGRLGGVYVRTHTCVHPVRGLTSDLHTTKIR